jgi:hypothetical protein
VTDLEIQRLLLDCGFKSAPPPQAARWAVAGGIEAVLRVTCATGARGGYVLLVASESERQQLLDILAQNGAGAVDVRAERMQARTPWLTLTVGAGALALFGWVLSTIRPFP